MIVVDASVWIAHLRNQPIDAVTILRHPDIADEVLVGDVVLVDVLQGPAMKHTRFGWKATCGIFL